MAHSVAHDNIDDRRSAFLDCFKPGFQRAIQLRRILDPLAMAAGRATLERALSTLRDLWARGPNRPRAII